MSRHPDAGRGVATNGATDVATNGATDGATKDWRLHRYRLVVIATEVGDVVAAAGGFLCDRARAGWDVSVLLADARDIRPLTILGVNVQDPGMPWASAIERLPRSGALAVSADLMGRDAVVRATVARVAASGMTEIMVWGSPAAGEIGRVLDPVSHSLSAAAKAFKMQALIAGDHHGGVAGALAQTETLFRPRRAAQRRLYPV